MKYSTSEHYNENLYEEVDSALMNNSAESVRQTLEKRFETESKLARSGYETQRIEQQLAHLATVTAQVEVAA